jgi:Trk K+ transport system NAD-binding subunit
MKRPPFSERLRYWFDNTMSKGSIALIGWLGLIGVIVVLLSATVIWFVGRDAEASFFEQLWAFAMVVLDAGIEEDGHWSMRLIRIVLLFTSIFVLSTLIGVLTTGLGDRIERLRKGRSRVIERDHSVILGWSDQVFPILSELAIANANLRRACVVILGERDKVWMEEQIRDKVGDTGRTRVVCRRGSPMDITDLQIVSLESAKSILIPSPPMEDPDSQVIKTMLAITSGADRSPDPYHIVADIRDPRNMVPAQIAGGGEAELVLAGNLIARIVAQTCRQSGLSVAYTELLDFAGDEIYFQAESLLVGKSFADSLLAYEDSTVIGIRTQSGDLMLNPPMDTVIQEGDEVIAISEDDDTVRVAEDGVCEIDEAAILLVQPLNPAEERTLILGWNWRAPLIINELDHYVASGSTVTVISTLAACESELRQQCKGLKNQALSFEAGDTTNRHVLEELALETYDHVILLSYSDELDPQQADAQTLVTLLHLRDIADQGGMRFSIVSEMQDIRNRNLARAARADDFIVSDRLISLFMSQIAENKARGLVFRELFNPEGSEIYLRPASDYVALGRPVSFYTMVESARRRGEAALGYRIGSKAYDPDASHGVVINPTKSDRVVFEEQDKTIVLSER